MGTSWSGLIPFLEIINCLHGQNLKVLFHKGMKKFQKIKKPKHFHGESQTGILKSRNHMERSLRISIFIYLQRVRNHRVPYKSNHDSAVALPARKFL